jgi:hypothetical protein
VLYSSHLDFEQSEDSDSIFEQMGERIHNVDTVLNILCIYLIFTIQRNGKYCPYFANEKTDVQRSCYLPKVIAK